MPIRWVISSRKRLFYSLLQNNLLRSRGIPFTKVYIPYSVLIQLPVPGSGDSAISVSIFPSGHHIIPGTPVPIGFRPILQILSITFLSFSLGEGSNYFLLIKSLVVSGILLTP